MGTMETGSPKLSRHNPLTFYLRTLLYMFMALLLRVAAVLPLGALFLFGAGSPWRWLALLCPVLLVFLVLPFRFSFAQALAQPAGERCFSFDTAFSASVYGEKLGESLLHALHVFKWGIPLWLMLGGVYYAYNQIDMISLMGGLSDLGAGITAAGAAVGNFFIGIFGGAQIIPNGGLMEGLYAVLGILGVGLLILLWGVVRNSAYRYIWAFAAAAEKNPRTEARRRLAGRRWKQIGVALINLLLWVPALYVTFSALKGVVGNLSDAFFNLLSTEELSLPEFSGAVAPLLFAFLVCYMPLLPIRRILTASFATAHIHHTIPTPAVLPVNEYDIASTASGAPRPMAAAVPEYGTGNGANRVNRPQQDTEPVPAYRPYDFNQQKTASQSAWAANGKQAELAYQPYQPEETAPEGEPSAPVTAAETAETAQPEAYRQTEPFPRQANKPETHDTVDAVMPVAPQQATDAEHE